MSLHFDERFRKKLQKVPHFVKKHEKSSILARTRSFSNKLPCFDALVNFSAKSCRKCLVFRENSKNHPLGQNLQLFRTKYHVYAFRWTFQEKVAKSASFREKARELIDLAKTCNFSNKLPCFGIFINFSAKSASFGGKAREIIDLAKTIQLFQQTTMFLHFDELLRKRWEKVVHFVKSTKTHGFGQNLQLFEKTTMFWRFDALFSKKLQKLPHFVKKHENSSILQKLCNFFEQTTMFWCFDELLSQRLQKVAQFVRKHEKSLIWPKLCNFSNKLQCLFPFDELSRKKLQKVRRLVKKQEKSSILSTCNFPRKLPCFDVSMNIAAKICIKLIVPW